MQNVAKATYREILERRAKENGIDLVNGVATAITPMAFLESASVKGYETLVDSDTKVDVHRHRGHAGEDGQVINAIKSTVPEEMWE